MGFGIKTMERIEKDEIIIKIQTDLGLISNNLVEEIQS